MRLVSAADAAGVVQSGQSVYLHCAAATPSVLLQALVDRASELRDVASSTSTPRDRARTWRPRWPATSGIARCSSARMLAQRSTRDAPIMSRSSCPTSRGCSRAARCRSMSCS